MLKLLTSSAFKIGGSEPLQKTLVNRLGRVLLTEQPRVQLVLAANIRFNSSYTAIMNSKHLATGAPLPPHQDGKLRIYNMRFCPYGQRAVLVALAKSIPHDIVNVHLKHKPEFLLERNPGGKVPTIDTPKGALYESLIVADYLDEIYPNRPLRSADPFQRALDRIWIENFSRIPVLQHKAVFAREDTEAVKGHLKELSEAFAPFEAELKRRGTVFYGGAQPGILDYMIWPWFERLPVLKLFFPDLYDFEDAKKQYPGLDNWRQAMKEDSAVKTFLIAPEVHYQFYQSFLNGTGYDVNYDLLMKN